MYAGIPVTDYATALGWYECLLGSPSYVASDTEAVWELAEHRSIFIEQRPEQAGHAMHTIFVDDLDELVADRRAGTRCHRAGDLLERRTQAHTAIQTGARFGGAPL
ncbi:hypothetical protein ACQEVF_21685 [Nonomuraea polychroma]|uniref:hypothetical protein n=1 Tax=Nonomuraea polychroma TaxID=46176 RepID=UPI003D8FB5B5